MSDNVTTEFVFDGMTPALTEYLKRGSGYKAQADATYPTVTAARKAWEEAGKPADGPTKEAVGAAEAAHYGALREYQEETERMREALPDGLAERWGSERKAWMCRDATVAGDPLKHASESGRFRLVVTQHTTGPGTWAYTKGRVYEGDRLIATICRNYSRFPFLFVEGHPRGDFLFCGEDYQGSTVVDLATGRVVSASTASFCWASYTASPSKRTLAVDGCYWAAPYEVKFVDIEDPMRAPLPVIESPSADNFGGWIGPDSCTYGTSYEVYVPLNKRVADLTEEETEDYDRREAEGEKGLTREDFVDAAEWHRNDAPKDGAP